MRWARYEIRDRYHVYTCMHCLRHGHSEKDCKHKDDEVICGKCAKNHKTNDCKAGSNEWKCQNCIRFKKHNIDHCVNSKYCEIMQQEIINVAERTDHGY